MIRAKVRTQFERNRNVNDLAVIDLLLFKGRQEYQETMNAWKQIPHIMKWFAEEEVSNEQHERLSHIMQEGYGAKRLVEEGMSPGRHGLSWEVLACIRVLGLTLRNRDSSTSRLLCFAACSPIRQLCQGQR